MFLHTKSVGIDLAAKAETCIHGDVASRCWSALCVDGLIALAVVLKPPICKGVDF